MNALQDKPLLDVTKAWELNAFKHDRTPAACRFSPCGKFAVSGHVDGRVIRWDLGTGERTEIGAHGSWISGIAFGGGKLFTADLMGGVKAWDAATGAALWKIDAAHPGWLKGFAASADGKRIATGGRDCAARVWSAEDGKLVREFAGHAGYVFSVAFHPDGNSLAAGDYSGKIRDWDLATGKLVRELDASILTTKNAEFLCDVGGVRAMAFDADGKRLAASGLREAKSNTFCPGLPTALVFDWATGKQVQMAKTKDDRIDGPVSAVRFLADGTLLGCAEGQSSGALWFWKAGEAEPFHTVNGHSSYEVDVHPDGRQLATASFEPLGKGGNGRSDKRGEYIANGGKVRILALYAKPAPPPKQPKKK